MRRLSKRPSSAMETDVEWAERLRQRSDRARGLGYWVGRFRGDFVGWWGLGVCDWDATTANLGYRLRPEWWGQGLATEGCLALLEHGLDHVGLDSVWASTTPHNEASQRVLAKLGMTYVGVEHDQWQYEVSGDAQRSSRGRSPSE